MTKNQKQTQMNKLSELYTEIKNLNDKLQEIHLDKYIFHLLF